MIEFTRRCKCGKTKTEKITEGQEHDAVIDGWLAVPVQYLCPDCVMKNKTRPGGAE